jgi:hypothetical protein
MQPHNSGLRACTIPFLTLLILLLWPLCLIGRPIWKFGQSPVLGGVREKTCHIQGNGLQVVFGTLAAHNF